MNKVLMLIILGALLLGRQVPASAGVEGSEFYCLKEANCQKGDIIVLRFSRISKENIARKVAAVCSFKHEIFSQGLVKDEYYVSCMYVGKKRAIRVRTLKD